MAWMGRGGGGGDGGRGDDLLNINMHICGRASAPRWLDSIYWPVFVVAVGVACTYPNASAHFGLTWAWTQEEKRKIHC